MIFVLTIGSLCWWSQSQHLPTERQVQQCTKHVRASPGWHFEQSHSASLKYIRLTSLVGWLLEPTCNLKISWKLRRLALLVLASNAIPGDTIRIPLHCTASPLPTVTTTQQWCTGSRKKVSGSGSVNAPFCTRIMLYKLCCSMQCSVVQKKNVLNDRHVWIISSWLRLQ